MLLTVKFPLALILPVKVWLSSTVSPKTVDPEETLSILWDTIYEFALTAPEIITSLPTKDMGRRLPVPSAKLVPSV
jgi:hypothetical protein